MIESRKINLLSVLRNLLPILIICFFAKTELRSEDEFRVTPKVLAAGIIMHSTVNIIDSQSDRSLGMGVVVTKNGFLITNYHVVKNQQSFKVKFYNGDEYTASVDSYDEQYDLALLKIQTDKPTFFKPVVLAYPDDLYLAEDVLTIGAPEGLEFSVAEGILSSFKRTFKDASVVYEDLIQISAKVNKGNSGGPVVNMAGNVIGLLLGVKTKTQGIRFVLPVKQILPVLSNWLSPQRRFEKGLGFDVETVFDRSENAGAVVIRNLKEFVKGESPYLDNGFEVYSVNGVPIKNSIDFYGLLLENETLDSLKIGSKSGQEFLLQTYDLGPIELSRKRFGMELEKLERNIAQAVSIPFDVGFVLSEINPSFTSGKKLRRGDMLYEIGDSEILDDKTLQKKLSSCEEGDKVPVIFFRVHKEAGQSHLVTVKDYIICQ